MRGADLADEVEAFVNGRLVAFLTDHGRMVPPWAALNRVAHATEAELEKIVETDDGLRGSVWVRPRSLTERFLAFHLLGSAAAPTDVRSIQRRVLIPLEQRFIDQYKTGPMTVAEVFEAANEALDRRGSDA